MSEGTDATRFVDLPDRGVTLCMARGGATTSVTGRPLVVLNGTGSDLRHRPNALEWPLASQVEVLTLDHRCLGRSTQQDPDYQPTMADFALDVLALCDAEGIGEFDLLGVSFGGMVAQEVAIEAGRRIVSLVLCCTSSGGAGGASYPLHDFYERGDDMEDMIYRWDNRATTDVVIEAQLLRSFRERPRPATPPKGLLQQIEARRHHDTWDRLDKIQADTFIACGEYDDVAPVANSRALAQRIHGAEVASFEGGHFFLRQDRTAWSHIIDFLVT